MPAPSPPYRIRTHWAVLAFMLGFLVIVVMVSYAYLFPALEAAGSATAEEKKSLSAYSLLLLLVVLFVLFSGLILTFRIGRFFFPGPRATRMRTSYPDAWEEAARRIEVDPDEKP